MLGWCPMPGRWCAAPEAPVGPFVVVVVDEGVDLGLKFLDGFDGVLGREIVLEGLVESFDLAAGLGLIDA